MDNFVLTISKFAGGRYFNSPQKNMNANASPNINPYVPAQMQPVNYTAPSYTAYQARPPQYRVEPPEPAKPSTTSYFMTNFSTSLTSPSQIMIDKRRLLLKNVPYSIDKEYLELYLEYLSDDNNEIERYDLLKHSKDSLVVTFLKDIGKIGNILNTSTIS